MEQYKDALKFLEEVKINADALFADLIIIKKKENIKIKKSIAKVFKKYNIVEYKSPKDGLTVRAFQKIMAYTTLYAFNEKLDFDEITATLVGNKYPRELLTWLKKKFTVKQIESGVYEVSGGLVLAQIIETKALNRENYRFLYALGNKLSPNELKETLKSGLTDEKLKGYIDLLLKENIKSRRELNMMSDEKWYKLVKSSLIGKKILEEGIRKGRRLERQERKVKKPVRTKAA